MLRARDVSASAEIAREFGSPFIRGFLPPGRRTRGLAACAYADTHRQTARNKLTQLERS